MRTGSRKNLLSRQFLIAAAGSYLCSRPSRASSDAANRASRSAVAAASAASPSTRAAASICNRCSTSAARICAAAARTPAPSMGVGGGREVKRHARGNVARTGGEGGGAGRGPWGPCRWEGATGDQPAAAWLVTQPTAAWPVTSCCCLDCDQLDAAWRVTSCCCLASGQAAAAWIVTSSMLLGYDTAHCCLASDQATGAACWPQALVRTGVPGRTYRPEPIRIRTCMHERMCTCRPERPALPTLFCAPSCSRVSSRS
eukprot:366029-Chlamydomonas_euryale.AAC.22